MLVYWLLFGYFALGAVVSGPGPTARQTRSHLLLAFAGAIIALLIGFRYKVGGDWGAYERMFSFAAYSDPGSAIALGDPGYQLLNWGVQQLGAGIWLVNLVCGLVFAWGLYRLVITQPFPWLSMLVAIPYLVIVVAMGYSRQGIAIGILMAGFADLIRGGSIVRFTMYVAIATLFHRTAVVALPLGALTGGRSAFTNTVVALSAGLLIYDSLVASSVDTFIKNYVHSGYSSSGAVIRVAESAVPALLFFLYQKYMSFDDVERKIWRNYSVCVLVCAAALMITKSSTFVDRLALYLIPLQIIILPRFASKLTKRGLGKILLVLYSAAAQFVWLNYADNANYWVPYKFYFSPS